MVNLISTTPFSARPDSVSPMANNGIEDPSIGAAPPLSPADIMSINQSEMPMTLNENHLDEIYDEDILNDLRAFFAGPEEINQSVNEPLSDDWCLSNVVSRLESLSHQGHNKAIEILQSELEKYCLLITNTKTSPLDKTTYQIIYLLIRNLLSYICVRNIPEVESPAQKTWFVILIQLFLHEHPAYISPLIQYNELFVNYVQEATDPNIRFNGRLFMKFCDYCNKKGKVPKFIFEDAYKSLVEMPNCKLDMNLKEEISIPNLTLLLNETEINAFSLRDLDNCLKTIQNELPNGHMLSISDMKERIETVYTHIWKSIFISKLSIHYRTSAFFLQNRRPPNIEELEVMRFSNPIDPPLVSYLNSRPAITEEILSLIHSVDLSIYSKRNIEEFKAYLRQEHRKCQEMAAAQKKADMAQAVQNSEKLAKELLEEEEQEQLKKISKRSSKSSNHSQSPRPQSESAEPTSMRNRNSLAMSNHFQSAKTLLPLSKSQMNLSPAPSSPSSINISEDGPSAWKPAPSGSTRKKISKTNKNLQFFLRNAMALTAHQHVERWRESGGDRTKIRKFSDLTQTNLFRYQNMSDDSIDLQYYSHYVPGLSSLMGSKFLYWYSREVEPPRGHEQDRSRSYQCVVRLQVPEINLNILTYMTLGLKQNGQIYHCYIHSEREGPFRAVEGATAIARPQDSSDLDPDIALLIDQINKKQYRTEATGESFPMNENGEEVQFQTFKILESSLGNIPVIELKGKKHSVTIYPLKAKKSAVSFFN